MHRVPAYRVMMRRRQLDVHRPQVAPPHPEPPAMPPAPVLHDWYVTQKRTLEQIARQHHTTRDTVRTWLQTAGIPVQPRTSREHRRRLDPVLLRDLYLTREWTAVEIAAELDTTIQLVLRALHDHGIPVRPGGTPRRRGGDQALRRLTALYQDPDVVALLRRHRIPMRLEAGTITERFPTPVTLTQPFLIEAYSEIGLATGHIEQLTGQPAEQVLQLLHDQGIPVRSAAHSPWLRRQRI
jgi:hypothetical protein